MQAAFDRLLLPVLLLAVAASSFAPSARRGRPVSPLPSASSTTGDDSADNGDGEGPRVVVLGGGFGGINAALTLPTLPWSSAGTPSSGGSPRPRITLVDRSERFVFLPLLYELTVDDATVDEVAPTFKSLLDGTAGGGFGGLGGLPDPRDVLRTLTGSGGGDGSDSSANGVEFVRAEVGGIDVPNRRVVVTDMDDGTVSYLEYDALIIATGAEVSLDAVPGAGGRALPFYTVGDALELRRRLSLVDELLDGETTTGGGGGEEEERVAITVIGGGYSGVELALNLVDRFAGSGRGVEVNLVHRGERVLEYATDFNRKAGTERLERAGVNVLTGTSVEEVLPGQAGEEEGEGPLDRYRCSLRLSAEGDGGAVESDLDTTLLLWTAGATPTTKQNRGIRNSILPRDAMGRILTGPTLNVPDHPEVFAIGDCGRVTGRRQYPATAQVAMQMATCAGWNVYATLSSNSNDPNSGKSGGTYPPVAGAPRLLPFNFVSLGEMMTLGSDDATISTLGGAVEFDGGAASWVRRLVYAARMPTPGQAARAAADGTGRRIARGRAGRKRRRGKKPVEWR